MEKHLQDIRSVSLQLFKALDKVGASDYMRRTRQHASITREILMSVTHTLTSSEIYTYFFGSSCEGTTTPGLKSDIDTVICTDSTPVVQRLFDSDKEVCFLMIQDDHTPPGYTKLLKIENNKIPLNGFIRGDDEVLDAFGRPVFINETMVNAMTNDERNGPAGTTLHRKGFPDMDYVPAFRCQTWPLQASRWLQKKRPYAFPSSNVKYDFEKYGFFVVPTGHPQSMETNLEWRLSFSIQERIFMCCLNEVQFKCYVVLKMIKKDLVKSALEGKSLTSYHCKTCLFYVIEQSDPKIWKDDNLIACVLKCIVTLREWLKQGLIPNYFIPEGNMWKGSKRMRLKVVDVLQNVLEDYPDVFIRIRCDSVGQLARSFIEPYASTSYNKRRTNETQIKEKNSEYNAEESEETRIDNFTVESNLSVKTEDSDDEDSPLVDAIVNAFLMEGGDRKLALAEISRSFSGADEMIQTISQSLSQTQFSDESNSNGNDSRIKSCELENEMLNGRAQNEIDTRSSPSIKNDDQQDDALKDAKRGVDLELYRVHYWTIDYIIECAKELIEATAESNHIDDCIHEHIMLIEHLTNITRFPEKMEHTEHHFQTAVNYVIPFVKTSLGSQLAAKAMQTENDDLRDALINDSQTNLINGQISDAMSGKVKHAAILLKQGDTSACGEILNKLDEDLESHVTSWGRCLRDTVFVNETLCNRITQKNESTQVILQESSSACVMYLPTELNIVPKELQYEMFRSVFAQEPRVPRKDDWFDCAVVDSKIYLFFLLYRLHEQLGNSNAQKAAQLYLMMVLEEDLNLGHPDTANNLLGCILKEQGHVNAACECFINSWKQKPDHNAAKWHMAIMLADAAAHVRRTEPQCLAFEHELNFSLISNEEENCSDHVEVIYRRTDADNN